MSTRKISVVESNQKLNAACHADKVTDSPVQGCKQEDPQSEQRCEIRPKPQEIVQRESTKQSKVRRDSINSKDRTSPQEPIRVKFSTSEGKQSDANQLPLAGQKRKAIESSFEMQTRIRRQGSSKTPNKQKTDPTLFGMKRQKSEWQKF